MKIIKFSPSIIIMCVLLMPLRTWAGSLLPYPMVGYQSPAGNISPTFPTPGVSLHYTAESLYGSFSNAPAPDSFGAVLLKGSIWLDARYRYEHVSQNGIHEEANASTLRTRVGYESGLFHGFGAGIELQNEINIGAEDYNNGINNKTSYPSVADPANSNINQAYLKYENIPDTDIKVGRQLINLDNQRFVGMSDWRQHDQTFNAASIYSTYFQHITFFYAYVRQVNRVFSNDSPVGTLTGNTHLINASYEFDPALKATGYGYLLDFDNSAASLRALSDATFGLRLTGKHSLSDAVALSYTLEGAHQTGYGKNPAGISENYVLLEPVISGYGLTGKLGYEKLGGSGTTSFQTPLASFHGFDGFADKFTTTPANGLIDRYGSLSYKIPTGNKWIKDTSFTGVYRQFNSDTGNINDGHEWDGLVEHTFFNDYTTSLEIADYRADHLFTDTTKFMAFLTVKY